MKKTILILTSILAIAGCANRNITNAAAEEDMIENGKIGYADIVSFLVQGYQCRWDGISPEDQGLSQVYSYCSELAGYAIKDIDGDGIEELLIGDNFGSDGYDIYDIYTINPADGSLFHLAKGGERDRFRINGEGVIIENGSNSAFDSFTKGYVIKDGKLEEVQSWHDSLLTIEFDNFMDMANRSRQLAGGYTDVREPEMEEYEMFRAVTDTVKNMTFTPLTVQTQVVAGINYKFYCRFSDGSEEYSPGHCYLTIYKPLPGQGEPRITSIEKMQ